MTDKRNKSCDPMTPAQRLEYAKRCAEMAIRMRAEGDIASAELNEQMAEIYAKGAE